MTNDFLLNGISMNSYIEMIVFKKANVLPLVILIFRLKIYLFNVLKFF